MGKNATFLNFFVDIDFSNKLFAVFSTVFKSALNSALFDTVMKFCQKLLALFQTLKPNAARTAYD
jgi:hypothetical protein